MNVWPSVKDFLISLVKESGYIVILGFILYSMVFNLQISA